MLRLVPISLPGSSTGRLMWQATPRQKVTLYYEYNGNCVCRFTIAPTVTPDGSVHMLTEINTTYGTTGATWMVPQGILAPG